MSTTAPQLISQLEAEVKALAYGDEAGLDRWRRRAEMVIRRILDSDSKYLKDLEGISFHPQFYPCDHVYEQECWSSAKAESANLLATIVEELTLFQTAAGSLAQTELKQTTPDEPSRTGRIFIGHGHSHVWRHLKDFLVERLYLQVDEFDQESPAGLSTQQRLKAMLDNASFAFLVMTAEKQIEKERYARLNVIHELGLFQGRLGFEKAIVLLEDGCGDFSNIHGLNHISFPEGDIRPAFEGIRKVLEREGILEKQSHHRS